MVDQIGEKLEENFSSAASTSFAITQNQQNEILME